MKLFFFLVAFCLVSIRFYMSWSGIDRERRGVSESNMKVISDNLVEEIKYFGKFQISDDENSFKTISPGGYFKYRKNDIRVKAESNVRGTIDYTIYDGGNQVPFEGAGKELLAEAVKEMIYWGFDAEPRMERIYQKGGADALLREVDSVKTDQVKILYLNKLFAIDSLLPKLLPIIVKKIGVMGSDQDKMMFLTRINREQMKNPQTDSAYFAIVEKIGSDMEKVNALQHLIKQDSLTDDMVYKILVVGSGLGSDMDKANVFNQLISRNLLHGSLTENLIYYVSHMGSDMDKVHLYSTLINENKLTEDQWIILEEKVPSLGSDMDKSNLLVEIAGKMPKTDLVRAGYRKAAKSINNDMDYGKAIRALD
jgi:hypothetical protein